MTLFTGKVALMACIMVALCGTALAQKCNGRPPNVVVIMVDDLGYHDLSIQRELLGPQGSTDVRSPNIDKLMKNGCIWTSAYSVAGFCSPARAGFMTGIHPAHSGHQKNPARDAKDRKAGMPLGLETIPETLKKKGYKSAMIGKWHLGIEKAFHPLNRGFDYFMGFLGSGFDYFEWMKPFRNGFEYIFEQYKTYQKVTYLTDDFTDKAIQFMRKNKNNPFFVFLAYNAVHGPYDYKQSDVDPWVSPDRVPHVAMIRAVDRGVGKIQQKLKDFGLDKCTMVVFTNDNGGHANGAVNEPLDGFKGKLTEGGIRVPMTFTYPGVIEKGQKTDRLASLVDIYPTIEEIAGVPKNRRNKAIEGVNLMPHMTKVGAAKPLKGKDTRAYLFNKKVQKATVRSGPWKVYLNIKKTNAENPKFPQPFALYNLDNDISESTNLIGTKASKVEAMRQAYIAWDLKSIDPIFPGNFRTKPIKLKYSVLPTGPLAVGTTYNFRCVFSSTEGAKEDKVWWEVFKPSAQYKADYQELAIRNDIIKVQYPKRLKTTIRFQQPGTWIVRCNALAGEWREWEDATFVVQ